MKQWIKFFGLVALMNIVLYYGPALASTIHTFANGERITADNLNAVNTHIHNLMVGGHGPRLVDADVSSSAAISHTKVATPMLIPKAWATTAVSCANPCNETKTVSSGVGIISHTALGIWTIAWSTARADATYAVLITPVTGSRACSATPTSTTIATIACWDLATPTAADAAFTVVLFDNL